MNTELTSTPSPTDMPVEQMTAAVEIVLQDLRTKAIALEALHAKTSDLAPSHVLCDSEEAFVAVHTMVESLNRQIAAIEALQQLHTTWSPDTQHDYMNPFPSQS